MRKILIDRNVTNPRECTYGFPWKHDAICYNFRTPDEVIAVNDIESIVDKTNIETLVIGCDLTDFDFIADMANLRQLYIYGKGVKNLIFLEKLFKLKQLYIENSHIENMVELVQLINEKKKCVDNAVDLWRKIEYGMEGICINSDRYSSNDGTELSAPGLFVSEIIVNQKHLRR